MFEWFPGYEEELVRELGRRGLEGRGEMEVSVGGGRLQGVDEP